MPVNNSEVLKYQKVTYFPFSINKARGKRFQKMKKHASGLLTIMDMAITILGYNNKLDSWIILLHIHFTQQHHDIQDIGDFRSQCPQERKYNDPQELLQLYKILLMYLYNRDKDTLYSTQ